LVGDGLDVEAQCGTDYAGVLPVDLQHNRSLPRIIKSTAHYSTFLYISIYMYIYVYISERERERERDWMFTYTMSIRISFSFLLIFRMILSSPIFSASLTKLQIKRSREINRISQAKRASLVKRKTQILTRLGDCDWRWAGLFEDA
jgi:hypothetical protein